MKVDNSQAVSEQVSNKKGKDGFMKSPRWVEYELFGPDSPLPDKWRVFNFIKYDIQDNKHSSETRHISKDRIIENTGICESNFHRIIKSLEKDLLIEVNRGNYRDSVAIYSLHKGRFKESVIAPDGKKYGPTLVVNNSGSLVDKSDKSKKRNFKMNVKIPSKLQNESDKLQNEVETPLTISELLQKIPLRSPELEPLKKYRSPEGNSGRASALSGDGNGFGKQRTEEEIIAESRRKRIEQQAFLASTDPAWKEEQMRRMYP